MVSRVICKQVANLAYCVVRQLGLLPLAGQEVSTGTSLRGEGLM